MQITKIQKLTSIATTVSNNLSGSSVSLFAKPRITLRSIKRIIAFNAVILLLVTALAACSKPLNSMTAAELLDLGEKYLLELNYEQAVVYFDKLIEIEPRNPRGYTGLAEIYIAQSNIDGAIEILQKGLTKLPDDRDFLEAAADLYEVAIAEAPTNADAYLGLADVYTALGNEDKAMELLRRGIAQLPSAEIISRRYYDMVIPAYTIEQTHYTELRADDGVLIWRDELNQPVFSGNSARIKKMNAIFANEIPTESTSNDSDWLLESYYSHEGYTYDEANNGRVGGSLITWKESYRKNQYISFAASSEWDGLGPHGGLDLIGRAFDCETGEALKLSDILTVSSENQVDTLYKEYIAYHAALGDGYDIAAQGYYGQLYSGSYNKYFVDSVKEQCGDSAVFWLADDGIHVYFNQYTFDYAAGSSELIIPYSRFDLIRAPFAVQPNDWKEAYMSLISAKASDIKMMEKPFDWSNLTPPIAIIDICGDETPELLFVARESYVYKLYVWGFDNGAVCMLNAKDLGAEAGAGATFGIAKLQNHQLLTFNQNGDEGWSSEYEVFELKDGILVSAETLEYGSTPQYQYENYYEMPQIEKYSKNGIDIDENVYRSEEKSLFSAIETPIIAFYYSESELLNHFAGNTAITYDKAIAYLTN